MSIQLLVSVINWALPSDSPASPKDADVAFAPWLQNGSDTIEARTSWLRDTLASGMIAAHYQPIVRLADGCLESIEVLARWRDTRLGLIPPDIFVPVIECAGLSEHLLKAVLVSGMPEIRALADLPGRVPAAFNLPLEMVLRKDALDWMEHHRALLGLETSALAVELTESHPVSDLPALARALERWTTAGYRLSIDDVTPTMPNYRALLDLPFYAAKLDRSVTRDSATSPEMARFLGEFVAAAHTSGKQIIAEGIESAADWRRMQAIGIDLGQGFLISPALPIKDIADWMDRPPSRYAYAQMA